jgi:hypothetical protein
MLIARIKHANPKTSTIIPTKDENNKILPNRIEIKPKIRKVTVRNFSIRYLFLLKLFIFSLLK